MWSECIYVNLNDVSVCLQLYLPSNRTPGSGNISLLLCSSDVSRIFRELCTTEMCFLNTEYLNIIITSPHHQLNIFKSIPKLQFSAGGWK